LFEKILINFWFNIKTDIKKDLNRVDNSLKMFFSKKKDAINIWVRVKIEEQILKLLKRSPEVLK